MESINESIARAIGSTKPAKPAGVPTARDCMATALITFHPSQPVRDIIDILLKHRISGAPVLDEERRLVGMISEMDVLRAMAGGAYSNEPFERARVAADLMTTRVITVEPNRDIYSMAQLFDQHNIRRLPVVDGETVVGQVSRRDVLRAIQETY